MPTPQELAKQCPNLLPGHGQPGMSMKHQLVALADSLSDDILPDVYGEGEYIAEFESDVAAMFGFSAGVFMPSGTMAQQIALRIWCDRKQNDSIAMHPTAHLETAKQGLTERLPKMASWVKKATVLAAIINQVQGALTNPVQPHCNMFQLFLKGDPEVLQANHDELAQTTGTYLFGRLSAAQMPGYAMTEIHCWENAMSFDESALNGFLTELLAQG